jgi:hypothetical protein
VSNTRWCYIDGCRNEATLVVQSYPDDITLCDDHLDCRGEVSPIDADWSETRVDLGGGMVVPLSELLEDDE